MHQLAAWRHLTAADPRSVLVTSGTGSGKTEAFLVPVLDHLARERKAHGRLSGVHALFLYPLNALINSQRDRLRAWTEGFGGDVRFCLYKGDTPDSVPAHEKKLSPEEVLDRDTLRKEAPPILVTNSTMLEYMLVRQDDEPILRQSAGKLRWIILDEAHTYLGSQAAEMALLLRRVLHSFQVSESGVRIVATSATIGEDGEAGERKLKTFLADLGGVDPDRVHVVRGRRVVPALPAELLQTNVPHPGPLGLRGLRPEQRFEALAADATVRRMRERLLAEGALTLTALTHARLGIAAPGVAGYVQPAERARTLELVDLCSTAERDAEPLLRVRAHFFHRTQGGIWACVNPHCAGRAGTALEDPNWRFGRTFFERRERCQACGSLVLELALCHECGAEYLTADEVSRDGARSFEARASEEGTEAEEYGRLISEPGDDTDEEAEETSVVAGRLPRLLTAMGDGGDPVRVRIADGAIDAEGPSADLFQVGLGEAESGLRCVCCGERELRPGSLFREARQGAPFFLRSIIPVLLDHTPRLPSEQRRPADGRRLITFTDSRQGTARFALDTQLDAERNYIRSFLVHQVAGRRLEAQAAAADTATLEEKIAALEPHAPPGSVLHTQLEEWRAELERLRSPQPGALAWSEAVSRLSQQAEIASWMRAHWRNLPLAELRPDEVAHFVLLREFVRRPKRHNSLETLGLVAVDYHGLDAAPAPPAPWSERRLGTQAWR
ncbi:MAG: DEAD/DEAH box helicase, partial [Gemmatimonadetes bacterium]|nr:DEAD/DEAH box helicase [Gemmatimonadota bacterium]